MSKPVIKSTTVATVSVTVRVHVGSWGPDCTMDQVLRQAREGAINRVRNLIHGDPRCTVEHGDCVDIETHVEGSK